MCLFNSGSQSQPSPPPAVVDTTNTNSQTYVDASNAAKSRAALAEGQSATNITQGTAGAPTTAQKTLLGQ